YGEGIEPELFDVLIALWMNRAGILVSPEIITAPINDKRLFELRKQNHTAHGWLRCRNEQAVIAPRVKTGDGRRSVATQSIGLQPLALDRGIKVIANLSIELNHALCSPLGFC